MNEGFSVESNRKAQFALILTVSAIVVVLTVGLALALALIDQGGANDIPNDGQNDLTQVDVDYGINAPNLTVTWSWDEPTAITGGGQSVNGCVLFDSDGDGGSDFALCAEAEDVGPAGSPDYQVSTDYPKWLTCITGTNDTDRCLGSTEVPADSALLDCSVAVTPTDPFDATFPNGPGSDFPDDLTITCIIPESLITEPDLSIINVCSYPSAGNDGNNRPFDCLANAGNGFLVIEKIARTTDANQSGNFTFNLGAGQTTENGENSWDLDCPTGIDPSPCQLGVFSLAPGTDYDLSEVINSGDWNEFALPYCYIGLTDTGAPGNTGTPSSQTVTDFEVQAGQTTTCVFDNNHVTSVVIGYVHAIRSGDQIDFSWQTHSESGTAGFNVIADEDGELVQLNNALIASSVVESASPTNYAFAAMTEATEYYLEEVTVEGKTSRFGPYEVGVEYGSYLPDNTSEPAIFLPFVR